MFKNIPFRKCKISFLHTQPATRTHSVVSFCVVTIFFSCSSHLFCLLSISFHFISSWPRLSVMPISFSVHLHFEFVCLVFAEREGPVYVKLDRYTFFTHQKNTNDKEMLICKTYVFFLGNESFNWKNSQKKRRKHIAQKLV